MLDLNFVRDHLPQVEAMLRNRGMDPAGVLRDFREVDAQRRQAITTAEELKAHRNRLSDKIPGMKKAGAGRQSTDLPKPKTCARRSRNWKRQPRSTTRA